MAAPAGGPAPIIVIKKIVDEEHGHHGGAWKVAYADFVTAMMAFFLLLWLLAATTEDQKKGIADYFDPNTTPSNSHSGSGGVMGGTTMAPKGAMTSTSSPFELRQNKTSPTDDQDEASTKSELATKSRADPNAKADADAVAAAMAAAKASEEQSFDAMEAQLKNALAQREDLGAMRDGLLVDRTEEGLRIQLIDQQNFPMFERGSPQMRPQARAMVAAIVQVIANSPNKLSIRGHTDSLPVTSRGNYDNWNLSSDRAIDTRRALLLGGLDPSRVSYVAGMADTDPLVPGDPMDGRNRRMSIILLRIAPVK